MPTVPAPLFLQTYPKQNRIHNYIKAFSWDIPTAHKSLVYCTPSVHAYLTLQYIFSCSTTQQHSTSLSPAAVLQFKFIIQTDRFPNSFQSCLLWLKIITLTSQTDTGKERNATDREGAFKSNHKTRKTSPIHHPNERTWNKTHKHWSLAGKRIGCDAFSGKNKDTRTKFECSKCKIGL